MSADTKAMFIAVEIDPKAAHDKELAKKLVEVCTVNIFAIDANRPATVSSQHATCRDGRSPTGGARVSLALHNLPGGWVGRTSQRQTAKRSPP